MQAAAVRAQVLEADEEAQASATHSWADSPRAERGPEADSQRAAPLLPGCVLQCCVGLLGVMLDLSCSCSLWSRSFMAANAELSVW